MEGLQRIQKTLCYMEEHLFDELTDDGVSGYVFSSKYNFQRMFHLVTSVTIGEYIRNRRLSLAGRDLQRTDGRIVDIASKYRYETSESFSKAFSPFSWNRTFRRKNDGCQAQVFLSYRNPGFGSGRIYSGSSFA